MDTLEKLEFQLASRLESVDFGEQHALRLARKAGFSEEEQFEIKLSVRECLVNAVEHGNRWDPCKSIKLSFLLYPDRLVIQVGDRGTGFNPDSLPDPLDGKALKNVSGRGVFLIRSLMDDFQVRRRGGGGAEVTLTKSCMSRQEEAGCRLSNASAI